MPIVPGMSLLAYENTGEANGRRRLAGNTMRREYSSAEDDDQSLSHSEMCIYNDADGEPPSLHPVKVLLQLDRLEHVFVAAGMRFEDECRNLGAGLHMFLGYCAVKRCTLGGAKSGRDIAAR